MFKLDSPLMNFLNKVCDIMILNFFVVLCCIPVFTAGASITAGYYVAYKMVRNEESYITKTFFKAFRDNFRQSTVIWMICLVAATLLFMDYRILFYSEMQVAKWVKYGIIAVTMVLALGVGFLFPVQARFDNTVKNTMKNAFLMAFSHLPSAFLFAVSYGVPVFIAWLSPRILPLVVLLGVGLLIYSKSILFLKIFKKYEPEEQAEEAAEGEGIFAVSEAMEKMSENKEKTE